MTEHKTLRFSLVAAFAIMTAIFSVMAAGVALPWEVIQPDTASYVTLASNLSEQGLFSMDGVHASARRELLYPLFLAGFMKLGLVKPYVTTVVNMLPVLAVQVLLYLWALSLLANLSLRWGMGRIAPMTVIAGVLYLPISQYAFQLVSELPALVLVVACFSALQRATAAGGGWRWSLAGLAFGLFTLLKSAMLPFGAVVAGLSVMWRRASLVTGLLFFCVSLLLPLSWAARNYDHFGKFIPGTTDGASSLYRGNMLLGEQVPSMGDPRIPREVLEEMRQARPGKSDTVLMRRVKERFVNYPLESLAHFVYKGFVLLFGLPLTPLHWLIMAARFAILALVVSRVVHTWRQGEASQRLVFVYAAFLLGVYTLIYTTPRYFIPALFMLLPFALDAAWHWGGKKKKGTPS